MTESDKSVDQQPPEGQAGEEGKRYWLDQPRNIEKIFWSLCTICALLAVADFLYHKHPHFSVEEFPVFYGLFGFAAFVFIVFAGKLLRLFVMRDEDYYDR